MNIVAIAVLAAALFTPSQQLDNASSAYNSLHIVTVSGSAGSLTGYEL
jgi:hypothetical protein